MPEFHSTLPPDDALPSLPAGERERHFWPAVLSLGVGSFAIGTGEFAIMGLLPEVARDLGVTIPEAGHVISTYALGVVIGAPVLAVMAAHWPRRSLLVALMVLFAIGNFLSAIAPGYVSLMALRLVAGLPHGAYFGVASLVAAALAAPGQRAGAVSLVMTGLTTATVVGVPLSAWMGSHLGWRSAFVLVSAIGALGAWLVHRNVPPIEAPQGAGPLRELGALARPQVWFTLGIAAVGFGGMFAVYSYIKPTLMEVTGLGLDAIPFELSLMGVGLFVGNLVGARLADRWLMRTIGGLLAYDVVVLTAFVFTAPHPVLASINVVLVGTMAAIGPALQIRLMDTAGHAQTLAAALNHSAFNVANALGAWLGGMAIAAGLGWTSTAWVGTLLALAGGVVFSLALWHRGRERTRRMVRAMRSAGPVTD
ncbi:MAG TPA: MFS transporter [Burkholderiaceae bacterium]|nr:MFS transporter [Burkholderiaceae bacterium]